MKTLSLMVLALLAGTASAAPCTNGSLQGGYTVLIESNRSEGEVNYAGKLIFDGAGGVAVQALTKSRLGSFTELTGSGTYDIGANCVGQVTLDNLLPSGNTMVLSVYLNQIDNSVTPNLAYSADLVQRTDNTPTIGAGRLTRVRQSLVVAEADEASACGIRDTAFGPRFSCY